jgi:hypothetical protein
MVAGYDFDNQRTITFLDIYVNNPRNFSQTDQIL